GRSIPRATGGPDEWLLPPLPGRGDRIRLTDLLRRAARPPRPEPARAQKTPAKSYLDSAPSAGVHRALLWGEVGYCGGAWGRVVKPFSGWDVPGPLRTCGR